MTYTVLKNVIHFKIQTFSLKTSKVGAFKIFPFTFIQKCYKGFKVFIKLSSVATHPLVYSIVDMNDFIRILIFWKSDTF